MTGRHQALSITALDGHFNATVAGDPNQDGNGLNDRLPGYRRNAFTGPDYATADLRITRMIRFRERYKLNLIAESFNLFATVTTAASRSLQTGWLLCQHIRAKFGKTQSRPISRLLSTAE